MSVKTRTFSMFDGKVPVTVTVGRTGEWFEAGPSCPPYKVKLIRADYAGCVFVSKPEKEAAGAKLPHVVFNTESLQDGRISEEVLLHECFHLFFVLLHIINQDSRRMRDIAHDEIYAREFTVLVDKVKKTAEELLVEHRNERRIKLSIPLQDEAGKEREGELMP